jgi:Peptidase family M23
MSVVVLQIVLPLALLTWLAVAPAKGWLAFVAQAAGTGSFLLALALAAMWIVPPWPTPYAYGLIYLAALSPGVRQLRRAPSRIWEVPLWSSLAFAALVLLGLFSLYVIVQALAGRTPPPGQIATIASPFPNGTYLVASGGSNDWVNAHVRTLDPSVPRFRLWRGQSYGVDIIKVDALGLRASGWRPAEPDAYLTFGAPLIAPCAGTVVAALDGLPDQRIPQQDPVHKGGNYVMIDCGPFVVALAHLQRGSVRVRPGDDIALGAPIGLMGNSGQSSEPHLHIHAQLGFNPNQPFGGKPMPLSIAGRYLARNGRLMND